MSKTQLTTPRGIARFSQNALIANDKGKYKLAISLDPNDEAVKKLLADYAESEMEFGKAHRGKFTPKEDKKLDENEEWVPNGRILINFTASSYRPKVFDSKNVEVKDPQFTIGNGSEIQVSFKMKEFTETESGKKGISKYPVAIKILSLVESSVTAESCGFSDAEEGDFTADTKLTESKPQVAGEEVQWDEEEG
jgi:hypothetical protein